MNFKLSKQFSSSWWINSIKILRSFFAKAKQTMNIILLSRLYITFSLRFSWQVPGKKHYSSNNSRLLESIFSSFSTVVSQREVSNYHSLPSVSFPRFPLKCKVVKIADGKLWNVLSCRWLSWNMRVNLFHLKSSACNFHVSFLLRPFVWR